MDTIDLDAELDTPRIHHPATCGNADGPCPECRQAARQWKLDLVALARAEPEPAE